MLKIKMFYKGVLCIVLLSVFWNCKNSNTNSDNPQKYTNALANETSPYLLQHAHNPVDWRPWSQAALDEAKEKNKLVLVSIGYSSCHWCHVMESETFENDSIAQIMNENFINIKVDREERPDVDQVYMTAVQLMQGTGGWPLNVITLPNGKPLYGGTYHTTSQWRQILTQISTLYNEDPEKAEKYSDMVAAGIQETNLITKTTDNGVLTPEALQQSVQNWKTNWDSTWGGEQSEEKFMLFGNLDFLLDYAILTQDSDALQHVRLSLDKMAMGGTYDHIAGGFFRYATDNEWKIPHFEKMLYDNAQAISLYAKAYSAFKKPLYKNIAQGTIAFLDREMKNTDGAYFAALDAQSEGKEGKFYVWTTDELQQLLDADYPLFTAYYGISQENIWEEDSYVLRTSKTDIVFAADTDLSLSEVQGLKTKWQETLLKARASRVRPRTDDKILISWNALLVSGFIDAYNAFGTPAYLDSAIGIFRTLQDNAYSNNTLNHSYKKDSKPIAAFLEDYAFLAQAGLSLYSASLNQDYLTNAQNLTHTAQEKFSDPSSGMYTYSQSDELIAKIIKTDDGVLPSPNAIMAQNLLLLGHINYDKEALTKAKTMVSSMLSIATETPYSYAKWHSLLLKTTHPFYEVAIAGENAKSLMAALSSNYIPNTVLVGTTKNSNLPLFEGRYTADGTYIYVCRDHTCKLPVKTVSDALQLLGIAKNELQLPVLGL